LRISANGLHASDGRETKALNCKPTTNLKEISELSNYSKTSGFRLHAVMCCPSSHCLTSFIILLSTLRKYSPLPNSEKSFSSMSLPDHTI
jgi:hypothetical protein